MKTAIVIGILLFAVSAFATEPFLIDPKQNKAPVEYYELSINGVVSKEPFPLDYDARALPDGQYTVTGKACNMWGCSESSDPFCFPKSVPEKPGPFSFSGK